MSANDGSAESRRQFLRFLASTPMLAGTGLVPYFASTLASAQQMPADLIRAAEDALNVFAFEPVAKERMLPVHYGYT
ncbi:MAG: twin-arginine translocation signal domain-containing protein, partial [Gammaproteobacteria bacterium]|nr:twin-arginine translocation signal domain-containing protein [Gammaproteobacteria bacterium]